MRILPIGAVVKLVNGHQYLMITARFPLYSSKGRMGYFDYASCLYPEGQINENNFFFNNEDIDEIIFEGFITDEEKKLRTKLITESKKIKYQKLSIKEF